jgi:hypothetical protein
VHSLLSLEAGGDCVGHTSKGVQDMHHATLC